MEGVPRTWLRALHQTVFLGQGWEMSYISSHLSAEVVEKFPEPTSALPQQGDRGQVPASLISSHKPRLRRTHAKTYLTSHRTISLLVRQ